MGIYVNIGGVNKAVSQPSVNINGAWKNVNTVYNKINGVWKTSYSYTLFTITPPNRGMIGYTTSTTNLVIPAAFTNSGTKYKVVGISSGAFNKCTSLTSITIPSTVTSIGSGAFNSCTSLTSITIPSTVTSMGDTVFGGCKLLTSITIPSSVTRIGNAVFSGCSSLTSITIPSSVTIISEGAFSGCSSLKSVYYRGTEAQWNTITIGKYSNGDLINATKVFNYTG